MKTIIKNFVFLLALSIIITSCQTEPQTPVSEEDQAELRQATGNFMQSLRQVLIKEIQNNGPYAAVAVCADTAQTLTQTFGTEQGLEVRRVSFSTRNEKNYPDEFEIPVLEKFEKDFSEGKLNESSEHFMIVQRNGEKYIHFMKPIILQGECVTCHGSEEQIPPDVQMIINRRYPNDKATGFAIGDLRGAVSVLKKLE